MRVLVGLLLLAPLLFASIVEAQQSSRIALVIGNADYGVPAWKLSNPVRDAELIGERLKVLGFDVDLVRNATKADLDRSFQRFGARLKAAGRTAVSVVFYAGHGAESDGANYLIPIDADVRSKDELRYAAPPAQFLLNYMAASGNAVNLLILDACRDMPLQDGARGLGRGGLAAIPEMPNVLIAYATAPNMTASDGDSGNSPFTAELAAALSEQPEEPVSLLFEDVQTRVHARSGGKQRPRFTNGLGIARWSFAAPKAPAGDPQFAAITALLAPVSLDGEKPSPELNAEFRAAASDGVFFYFEEAVLPPEAQAALDSQAKWLLAHPKVRARIYGNADEQETNARVLGAQRAKAVRDYLLGCGVPPEQIGSTTYGLDRPVARTADEAARAMNRRVETQLVSVARD